MESLMKRIIPIFSAFFLVILLVNGASFAQKIDEKVVFLIDIKRSHIKDDVFKIILHFKVKKGWHINGFEKKTDFLKPSTIEISKLPEYEVIKVVKPESFLEKTDLLPEPLPLIHGDFTVEVYVKKKAKILPSIKGKLFYQACSGNICLPPTTLQFTEKITEKRDNSSIKLQKETAKESKTEPSYLKSKNFFALLFFVFLGGLALNLTPCIYPLIPITVAFFTQQSSSKGKLFLLGLLYLLGIATSYSLLGLSAALGGGLFGWFLQNSFVQIGLAALMVILAFSLFGTWEIRLPHRITSKVGMGKKGYLGSLFMGLTIGIVGAPCIGPFIIGLLTFVGERSDPIDGIIIFFVLAVGMGLPITILGILSRRLEQLPRSGEWMLWIRKFFGFVLLGMAIYFLMPLLPQKFIFFLVGFLVLVSALYLGWIEKSGGYSFNIFKKIISLLIIIAGVAFIYLSAKPHEGLVWQPYKPTIFQDAKEHKKPIIIDWSAKWCLPCRELEVRTFTDIKVREFSKHFLLVRIDLTHSLSQEEEHLRQKLDVVGVPTILFFLPNGKEVVDLRITGFIPARKLILHMKRLYKLSKEGY